MVFVSIYNGTTQITQCSESLLNKKENCTRPAIYQYDYDYPLDSGQERSLKIVVNV